MDPLSVSASVVALLAAGSQVVSLINKFRDVPQSLKDIEFEVKSLNIIISGLQRFVERTSSISPIRAALIPVQDVVTIVTETVLVYNDLEGAVRSWSSNGNLIARTRSALGRGDAAAARRLVNQLQRHKTSLSLILQIIQCGSDLEAQETSETLRAQTDQALDDDIGLANRLQSLEVPEGTIGGLAQSRRPSISGSEYDEKEEQASISNADHSQRIEETGVEPFTVPEVDCSAPLALDEVLAASRAYLRVRNMECDAVSCVSTTRSYGWSILSGISSSQVTRIGVICLPLYEAEVKRFLDLAFPPGRPVRRVTSSAAKTIQNHFDDLQQEFGNTGISAGLMGDDVFHWRATIMGPHGSPYEGGVFFLAMHFPEQYPFKQPKTYFTTRVYHPNVSATGQISTAVRRNHWNPSWTPAKLLLSIQSLLVQPDMDDVLVNEIAQVYRSDRVRYEAIAKEWTTKYAI